jgi:hypothetical protein
MDTDKKFLGLETNSCIETFQKVIVDTLKKADTITSMKATITIQPNEIETILRAHLQKIQGIQKITFYRPVLVWDNIAETCNFEGIAIEVELAEQCKS